MKAFLEHVYAQFREFNERHTKAINEANSTERKAKIIAMKQALLTLVINIHSRFLENEALTIIKGEHYYKHLHVFARLTQTLQRTFKVLRIHETGINSLTGRENLPKKILSEWHAMLVDKLSVHPLYQNIWVLNSTGFVDSKSVGITEIEGLSTIVGSAAQSTEFGSVNPGMPPHHYANSSSTTNAPIILPPLIIQEENKEESPTEDKVDDLITQLDNIAMVAHDEKNLEISAQAAAGLKSPDVSSLRSLESTGAVASSQATAISPKTRTLLTAVSPTANQTGCTSPIVGEYMRQRRVRLRDSKPPRGVRPENSMRNPSPGNVGRHADRKSRQTLRLPKKKS